MHNVQCIENTKLNVWWNFQLSVVIPFCRSKFKIKYFIENHNPINVTSGIFRVSMIWVQQNSKNPLRENQGFFSKNDFQVHRHFADTFPIFLVDKL